MTNDSPFITVVIPTYNRHDTLPDSLRDIINQDYKNFEIIVVEQSNNCSDETLEMAKKYPEKIKLYHVNFKGLPTARNFGMQMANGEYLIFIDDDIRCGPEFLGSHADSFVISGAEIQGGGVQEKHQAQPEEKDSNIGRFNYWTAIPIAGFQYKVQKAVDHVKGCNFGLKKSIFEIIKGFDEALNPAAALYEELDLCLRAKKKNLRIYFNGNARLTHLASGSGGCRIPDIRRYLWSLSRNRTLIIRRHLPAIYQISAFAKLFLTQLSHVLTYRNFGAIYFAFKGVYEGFRIKLELPVVSMWTKEEGKKFLIKT